VTAREDRIQIGGLPTVAVGDREAARAVVVLLHGFQMEPSDLSPFAHSIGSPAWFLFPEGPLAAEPRGRAWWHSDARRRDEALRRGPRDFAGQHPPGLPQARARLLPLLEAARVAAGDRPLIVGGFSQGGMLSCDALLRCRVDVDGLALLSASRIAFDEWGPLVIGGRVGGLPVLVSHGRGDPELAFSAGEALRDFLTAAGADVSWVPFDQGHEIPLVVWRHLRRLIDPLAEGASPSRRGRPGRCQTTRRLR
jgi:phospholipase/carboxylesterase